jgi:hypothetical protein
LNTPPRRPRDPREAYVTEEQLERILSATGARMILIGGQALAFWAAYYRVPPPIIAITKDVDLLALPSRDVDLIGSRDDVKRLANSLSATAHFPNERALTALVGQVRKHLPSGDYINIDVLHRVYGDITNKAIESRAVDVDTGAGRVRVMHPMDVLQGRLENVHGIPEKQDEHGRAQLELAIEMTRHFLADIAQQGAEKKRPPVLAHVSRIEKMATSDAGRKVAHRHGLFVADAIDPAPLAQVASFVTRKLPQLLELMSPARRAQLSPPP